MDEDRGKDEELKEINSIYIGIDINVWYGECIFSYLAILRFLFKKWSGGVDITYDRIPASESPKILWTSQAWL